MTRTTSETTARIRFIVGKHVSWNDRILTVVQPNPDGGVVLRDLTSGAVETLTVDEVLREYESDRFEFVADPDQPARERGAGDCVLADVAEHLLEEAYQRKAYCEVVDAEECPLSTKALATVIAKVAAVRGDVPAKAGAPRHRTVPSPSTLRRWMNRWVDSDRDLRALVKPVHLRGNRTCKLTTTFHIPDAVVAEMNQAVLQEYLRPERPTKQMAHKAAVAVIDRHNQEREVRGEPLLHVPSYRAISAWLARQDQQVLTAAREGKRKANRKFTPVQLGPVAVRPLQIVEADHTTLNVIIVDESGLLLGRPILTALLDRCTRVVYGFHVGLDKPGGGPVMSALRNGVMPKTYIRTEWPEFPPIPADWPVFGRPETLVVDNGPEFHGHAFKLVGPNLGIQIQWCPGGCPWFKGIVERWMGTSAVQLVNRLPGTTFANTVVKGDYKSEKMAVMTLRQLRYAMTYFIVAIYNRSHHEGLYDRPMRLWEEKIRSFPPVLVNRKDLDCLLGGAMKRHLTAEGIRLFGIRYLANEDTVSLLRRHGDSVSVTVRYDPADLGEVKVYDADARCYLSMRAACPDYASGLSAALHHRLRKIKREQGNAYASVSELARLRADLHRLFDQWARDGRKKSVAELGRLLGVADSSALFGDHEEEAFPEEEVPDEEVNRDAEAVASSMDAVTESAPGGAKPPAPHTPRAADQTVERPGPKAPKRGGAKPTLAKPVRNPAADGADDDDFTTLPIRVEPGRTNR